MYVRNKIGDGYYICFKQPEWQTCGQAWVSQKVCGYVANFHLLLSILLRRKTTSSLPLCFNYSLVIACLNYSYPPRALHTLFVHWFALMYTMAFVPIGNLIDSDTFSQENTSPKQIIIQNTLCNKSFSYSIDGWTKRKKIIQWKKTVK